MKNSNHKNERKRHRSSKQFQKVKQVMFGKTKFFRVREFQFLLGKICVAHSVAHSFILLF